MIDFSEYILEELSKEYRKELSYYIDNNYLTDDNFKSIFNIIALTDINKILSHIPVKKINSVLNIFNKYNVHYAKEKCITLETLDTIKNKQSTIYDILKLNDNTIFNSDEIDNIINDLKELKTIGIGKFEILLSLLLKDVKEKDEHDKFDIYIDDKHKLEVKGNNGRLGNSVFSPLKDYKLDLSKEDIVDVDSEVANGIISAVIKNYFGNPSHDKIDINFDNKIEQISIKNLIGYTQLICYQKKCGWTHMIVFNKDGNYNIIKTDLNNVIDVTDVLDKFKFVVELSGGKNDRQNACKILLK